MKFFYTCQQAHQVISEGLDSQLSFSQKSLLAVHLGICRSCGNFKTQMQTLRLAMKQLSQIETNVEESTQDLNEKK